MSDPIYYDSSETGAPVLNNAAGSLDAVLYACLVTGFRTVTLDNIDPKRLEELQSIIQGFLGVKK